MPLDALEMEQGQYPMAGALLIENTFSDEAGEDVTYREMVCTATLIAPDVVLTAGHCVDWWSEVTRWSPKVDLRRWDRPEPDDLPDWPAASVEVTYQSAHLDHEGPDELGLAPNADIGLAFLEHPWNAPLAWLPTEAEGQALAVGDDVEFAGWGIRNDGGAGLGQWSPSRIASMSDDELQIWSDDDPVRACYGDSGGPTFGWADDGGPRLIGVHVHGFAEAECEDTTGVDTRVDRHLDWIDAEMRWACDNGLRTWCREPGILPAGTNPLVCGCSSGNAAYPGFAVSILVLGAIRRPLRCRRAAGAAPTRRRS